MIFRHPRTVGEVSSGGHLLRLVAPFIPQTLSEHCAKGPSSEGCWSGPLKPSAGVGAVDSDPDMALSGQSRDASVENTTQHRGEGDRSGWPGIWNSRAEKGQQNRSLDIRPGQPGGQGEGMRRPRLKRVGVRLGPGPSVSLDSGMLDSHPGPVL